MDDVVSRKRRPISRLRVPRESEVHESVQPLLEENRKMAGYLENWIISLALNPGTLKRAVGYFASLFDPQEATFPRRIGGETRGSLVGRRFSDVTIEAEDIEAECRGPDGKPDFEKMRAFMAHHKKSSRLDAVGWALFFIWVGIAWLANLGMGVGLLGVGLLTLGMQLFRKLTGVAMEPFWLVVGALFVLGGIWDLLAIEAPLVPVLLVLAGIALLVGAIRSRSGESGGNSND